MFAFTWANKQLEKVAETLAPALDNNTTRFQTAVKHQNVSGALSILACTPGSIVPDAPSLIPSSTLFAPRNNYAIHVACAAACPDVVHALIQQYGISAEQFDAEGNTPLHYAASSTTPIHALSLVQSLVNNYNVTVTIKNAKGQTAYDVASQDSIRQFLLPIQLQRETQECIDNGGVGLVPGMDMGGMTIPNHNLAPPPTMSTMGGVGGNGSGARSPMGAGVGGYVVPSYASPAPMMQQPAMQQYPPTMNTGMAHGVQPMSSTSTMMHQPSPAVAPFSPTPTNHHVAAGGGGGGMMTPNATPMMMSAVVPAPVDTQQQQPPSIVTPMEPVVVADTTSTATKSTTDPVEEEPIKEEETIAPSVNESKNVTTLASSNSSVPVAPAEKSFGSTSTTSAAISTPTPSIATARTAAIQPTARTAAVVPAPSSSSSYTSTHARRGHSTAAVMPKNSKYKPDGFHSSSSDATLAQKYGHDTSVGPPSGNLHRSVVGPPPTSGGSMGAGANAGSTSGAQYLGVAAGSNSGVGSNGGAGAVALNPFAGGSAVQSQYGRYGGAVAVGGRNRYPTYDAVSDSVGMVNPSMGAGGVAGGAYANPYAAHHVPQYNVYQPVAAAAPTPSYTTMSWTNQNPNGGGQDISAGGTSHASNLQAPRHQGYDTSTATTTGTYGATSPAATSGNFEGLQHPQTQTYSVQQQDQQNAQYYTGYSQEQQPQYQQYQSNNGAPSQEQMVYSSTMSTENANVQAPPLQLPHESTTANSSVVHQPSTLNNFSPPQEQPSTTTLNASTPVQGNDGQTQSQTVEKTIKNTGTLVMEQVGSPSVQGSSSNAANLPAEVTDSYIMKDEAPALNFDSKISSQVAPFAQPISASELFGATATKVEEEYKVSDVLDQSLKEETQIAPDFFPPPPISMDDEDEIDLSSPPMATTSDAMFSPPPNVLDDDALSSLAIASNENTPVDAEDDTFLPPPPIADVANDTTTILGESEDELPPPPMFDVSL